MQERNYFPLMGTRDLLGEDYASIKALQDRLQGLFSAYGYRTIDTPTLEQADLYLLKSGAEIASRIYAFTDPGGGRVALRPEFTAGVIRAFLQRASEHPLPLRWQYCGPVFRYGPQEQASFRQMTQLGAELIGASGPRADAEMVTMAVQGLAQVGLSSCHLVVGHAGITVRLLGSLGLSEKTILLLMREPGRAKSGAWAQEEKGEDSVLKLVASSMSEEEARSVLLGLLRGLEPESLGNRTREEIVERLLRKLGQGDAPALVERGATLVARLGTLHGEPSATVERCRRLVKELSLPKKVEAVLDLLESTVSALAEAGLPPHDYVLDLGLTRDLAYYTGLVFEVRHTSLPEGSVLGGGGRYNGLIKALGGGEDVPALGFAYTLENILQAAQAEGLKTFSGTVSPVDVLVIAQSSRDYSSAAREAKRLRGKGKRVELEVREVPLAESISYAEKRSIPEVIIVGRDGRVVSEPVSNVTNVAARPF